MSNSSKEGLVKSTRSSFLSRIIHKKGAIPMTKVIAVGKCVKGKIVFTKLITKD